MGTNISLRVWVYIGMLICGWKSAQAAPTYVEGEAIIQLTASARSNFKSSELEIVRELVPSLGIYLAKTKAGLSTRTAIQRLQSKRAAGVGYIQPNHYVQQRTAVTPNDPEFSQLWSLQSPTGVDVDGPEAWGLFSNPLTAGAGFVVAVVDGGVDRTHPDLSPNLWTNAGEIPGNGIDDDGNGYIDDFNGWNAFEHNGNPPTDMHATHVAGIVSAKGNNTKSIVGVNWNVKVMSVAASSGTTSIVLEGYNYVLTQKHLWNTTRGAKGANVVATNSSFGVDQADCTSGDFPSWNAIYEAMGREGILSAAATANLNINVDQEGDVPTGCTSDYLIAVTNTDNRDQRNSRAAYGAVSVDLGAPGTDIVSTLPGNRIGALTGTSMATPHVAGAIAYMHSVASPAFRDLYATNPARGALEIRRLLLTQGVDPVLSMRNITSSGGRLNLFKAGLAISTFSPTTP